MRLVLLGYMGSGKSSVGALLSKRCGVEFVDLDHRIEESQGMTIGSIFELKGESAFREMERDTLREILMSENDFVLSLGGGTACFHDNMTLINQYADSIYLKAPAEILAENLKYGKSQRPLLKGKTQEELIEFIKGTLVDREPFYSMAKHKVSIDGLSIKEVEKKIYETIII